MARRALLIAAVIGIVGAGALLGGVFSETPTVDASAKEQPREAAALAELGLAYEQRARETADPAFYAKAESAYERLLDVDPESYAGITGLASVAASRHEFADALRLARRAVALRPARAPAYGILGDSLVELGRYRPGFAAFKRMAALDSDLASVARVAYGRELLGWPRGALEALTLALEVGSSNPEHVAWALTQTGDLLHETGRLRPAANAHRAALDRVAGYVEAEAGLARVDAARGRYGSAIERWTRVVVARPDAGHEAELGHALHAVDRQSEARLAYSRAKALLEDKLIDPESILVFLDLGGDTSESLTAARALHAATPTIHAEDALAWALYREGRCGEAREHSVRALRLGTRDALMYFHRGMIERCLGHEGAARTFLTKALQTNPHFSLIWAPLAERVLSR